MEESIKEALKIVGISRNEIAVLLDLIKHPKASAQEVSKRANIYRANAYEALRRLKKRGLIDETKENNSTFFRAKSPESLLEYVNQQKREIEKVIPLIKKIKAEEVSKEAVFISHGLNSFRDVHFELLKIGKPIYTYNVTSNVVNLLGQGFLDEYHRKRIQKKIKIEILFNKETGRLKYLNSKPFTEAKYLYGLNEKSNESVVTTIICGDFVYVLIYESPYTSIKIESKRVAESFYSVFKSFWEIAKKPIIDNKKFADDKNQQLSL
jgi:sugar-specific transcriptional regulator TrmB